MATDRRTWLRKAGLLIAGVGLARFDSIAAPVSGAFTPAPLPEDGPVILSFNENPYGPSPLARTAMQEAVNISNRYPWSMIHQLMDAIGAKNNLKTENVQVGAGSTQIIDAVIQFAALQKGNFIVADLTFNRWKDAAESCGLKKITIPLTKDKRHDLPAMLQAITPDTRMIYICNPNNPTGTICNYDSLVSFIKEATKKTLVLVDEAYLDYTTETSLCSLVTGNETLVVVKTFSKIYGLAGARIGYALAHTNTIEKIGGLQSGADLAVSATSLAAAIASLKDNEFVKESYEKNKKTKEFVIEQLERLHIPCIHSHSNFIYFSLANYKKDFFGQLKTNNIQGTGIFEEEGKWSRITVGTMPEMKKFISALE